MYVAKSALKRQTHTWNLKKERNIHGIKKG